MHPFGASDKIAAAELRGLASEAIFLFPFLWFFFSFLHLKILLFALLALLVIRSGCLGVDVALDSCWHDFTLHGVLLLREGFT